MFFLFQRNVSICDVFQEPFSQVCYMLCCQYIVLLNLLFQAKYVVLSCLSGFIYITDRICNDIHSKNCT